MDDVTRNFVTNALIDLNAIVEKLAAPKPADWRDVARDAAVQFLAARIMRDSINNMEEEIGIALIRASALANQMRVMPEFGGSHDH